MAGLIVQDENISETSLSNPPTTPALGSEISLSEQGFLDTLPEPVREHPLLAAQAWQELRDSGRSPLECSDLVTTLESRAEFLVGAWLIDKIVPPGLGGSLLGNIQPQMLLEADILNAGHKHNGVLEPRRSSKTTSLWCVLLGRCFLRPVHMAGFSMLTTAKKTTERFRLDVFGPISRKWPDPKTRPVKLINSNGFERVEFDNGSVMAILSPEGDAIRSGAYDTLVLDEGGEADPVKWGDVIASVLPSFDTRGPGAQLIIAGTGGKYREGSYFWAVLHKPGAGVLRFGVHDDIDEADLQTWETVGPIVDRIHPGLDGLTTLETIEDNFYGLGSDLFAREYLGHFGHDVSASTAIPHRTWAHTLELGSIPENVTPGALAFAIHPGGLWASVAIAWHLDTDPTDLASAAWALDGDEDQRPPQVGFKLVHHQAGNDRLPEVLFKLARAHRLPIVHDDQPQEKAVMQELIARARPRPRAQLARFGDKGVAHTKFLNGLKHKRLVHWAQEPLDKAARIAVTRMAGKTRLLGIPDTDATADTTPLEAAALAIHYLPAQRDNVGAIVVD
jgi:hypothetical protein